MTIDTARKVLILASLAITGCQMAFLLLAPAFGYPLPYPKNLDLLQLISPVFLGYLGAASHFVFHTPAPGMPVQNQYLGPLLVGPLLLYAGAVGAALGAFGYTNRADAPVGVGMSVANLATALSLCLGVLAATTGVLSSYLFMVANRPPTPAAQAPATAPS